MENRLLISPALAWLGVLPWLCSAVPAASPDRPLITVGTALNGSVSGTCVMVQSEAPDDARTKLIQVFRKPGNTSGAGTFSLCGQIRPQSDPRTVGTLLERGRRLFGDDLDALNRSVDEQLQAMKLADGAVNVELREKLAVLVAASESDVKVLDNLRFLSRKFKGVGLAAGFTFAEEISGLYTYELRTGSGTSTEPSAADVVIGRVIIDTASPVSLPAPDTLRAVTMTDARGHRVVRLRWASPDTLRRTGPLHFGYQLYRVPAASYDPSWVAPPAASELEAFRVNTAPILASEEMTAAEAETGAGSILEALVSSRHHYPASWSTTTAAVLSGDASYAFPANEAARSTQRASRISSLKSLNDEQARFHFIDDGGVSAGTGALEAAAPLVYHVAALDIVGRPGALSQKLEVIVPRLEPSEAPKGVSVENRYSYAAGGARTQRLEVRWPALRDAAGAVRTDLKYMVYRWNAATEGERYAEEPFGHGFTEFDAAGGFSAASIFGAQPELPVGLVAGPGDLPPVDPADGMCSWTDPSVTEAYKSIQFHYAVRAVLDSGRGFPVISAPSAPARGVLRDRAGPGPATVDLEIPFGHVVLDCGNPLVENDVRPPSDGVLIRVHCKAALPELFSSAEFAVEVDGERIELGSAPFGADGYATRSYRVSGATSVTGKAFCRAVLTNGLRSEEKFCVLSGAKETRLYSPLFNASYAYDGYVPFGGFGGVYFPVWPGGPPTPPAWTIFPAPDTYAYRIYRRVDFGEEELLATAENASTAYDTAVEIRELDTSLPAHCRSVCYYYQGFDRHGNPGPRQRAGCLDFAEAVLALPVPDVVRLVRVPGSTGSNPGLTLSWFCPPEGVEAFEILVRKGGGDPPASLDDYSTAANLLEHQTSTAAWDDQQWAVYRTQRLSGLTQDAGVFSMSIGGIEVGAPYTFHVRSVGNSVVTGTEVIHQTSDPGKGDTASWENAGDLPSGPVSPNVPWPPRAIAGAIDLANSRTLEVNGDLRPEFVNTKVGVGPSVWNGAVVRIGEFDLAAPVATTETSTFTRQSGQPGVRYVYSIPAAAAADWKDCLFTIRNLPAPSDPDIMERTVLPCVVYRMNVNAAGQPISRNLIQCSPRIDEATAAIRLTGGVWKIEDPHLHVGLPQLVDGLHRYPLYIKDTQPVIHGDRYRYLLALFRSNGELETVLDLGILTIP